MKKELLENIKNRKTAFFIGAGVSMISPTCLPSWWQINHSILNAMAYEAGKYIEGIEILAEKIKERGADNKLPPEFIAELITQRFGDSYYDVLKSLESKTPNMVHFWTAILAKFGHLDIIMTTNFDTLIEQAFAFLKIPLKVLIYPSDYENFILTEKEDLSQNNNPPCYLIKLHGTISDPKTCIDTLSQRKKGLDKKIQQVIDKIGIYRHWVIMGYSGADLSAEPNYLGIRERSKESLGFTWLQLKDTTPLSVVKKLVSEYQPSTDINSASTSSTIKGIQTSIEYAMLPEWMDSLTSIAPKKILKPLLKQMKHTTKDLRKRQKEVMDGVHNKTKKWAEERHYLNCAVVLSDIAIHAGYIKEAKIFLEKMLITKEDMGLNPFGFGMVFQTLGNLENGLGNIQKAAEYLRKAHDNYKVAGEEEEMLQTLETYSTALSASGQNKQALEIIQKLFDIKKKRDNEEDIMSLLILRGHYNNIEGKQEEALNDYGEAYKIAEINGFERARVNILLKKALIYRDWGETNKTLELINETLITSLRLGDDSKASSCYLHLSELYWSKGNTEKAYDKIKEAEFCAERVDDKDILLEIRKRQARMAQESGDYPEAEKLLINAIKLSDELGIEPSRIENLIALSLLYQSVGKLEKSRDMLNQALNAAEKLDLKFKIGSCLINLGIIDEMEDKLDEANDKYMQALEIFKDTRDIQALSQIYGNMGNVNLRKQNYEDALKLYEKGYEFVESSDDIDGKIRLTINLATCYSCLNLNEKAEENYQNALKMTKKHNRYDTSEYILTNYANYLYGQKNWEKSIPLYEDLREMYIKKQNQEKEAHTTQFLGVCCAQSGKLDKAIKELNSSINIYKSIEGAEKKAEDVKELLGQVESFKEHKSQ